MRGVARRGIKASILATLLGIGCGGSDGPSFPGPTDDVPAIESNAMERWIAGEAYKRWTCEPSLRPARDNSPHGQARICQNSLLVNAAAGMGAFPLGAASVKEQGDSGAVETISVVVRGKSGAGGDAWYWWRKDFGGDVVLKTFGATACTGCHQGAPRDFVFTVLR